jgi:hypothetical protein
MLAAFHVKFGVKPANPALTPNPSPSMGEGSRRQEIGVQECFLTETLREQNVEMLHATSLQQFSCRGFNESV